MYSRLSFALIAFLFVFSSVGCDRKAKSEDKTSEPEVIYQAPKRGSVAGQVSVPDEFPAEGVMIYAEGTSYIAMTDPNGDFILSGLPVGNYLLRTYHPALESSAYDPFVIAEEDLEGFQPYLELPAVELAFLNEESVGVVPFLRSVGGAPTGSLVGQVLTTNPLESEGVSVTLLGTAFRTLTDQNGNYSFVNVPVGRYQLRFDQTDYRSETISVSIIADEQATALPVRLFLNDQVSVAGRTILGSVTAYDADGSFAEIGSGISVYLEGTTQVSTPDASGRFQFSNLDPGIYVVGARAQGYLLDRPQQVDLTSIAAAEVSLILNQDPALADNVGVLGGRVVLVGGNETDFGGITVSLAGTSQIAATDSEGFFVFEQLPPGTYTISASYSQYEPGRLTGIEVVAGDVTTAPPLELEKIVEAPRVVATAPANGATGVTITDPVRVVFTFSQRMDYESLLGAVSISPEVEYSVAPPGRQGASDDQLVLLLEGYTRTGPMLKYRRQYTITIDQSASNLDGVPMEEDFDYQMATGPAEIVRTNPPDGARSAFVNISNPIAVYFNAALDQDDMDRFEASDISFSPETNTQPNVYFRSDPETGWSVLLIGNSLEFDEDYSIRIRGRLRTISGDRISNLPYRFQFKTTRQWEGLNPSGDLTTRERREEEERRRN